MGGGGAEGRGRVCAAGLSSGCVGVGESIDGLVTAEAYEPTPLCEELCARDALVAAPTAGEVGSPSLSP